MGEAIKNTLTVRELLYTTGLELDTRLSLMDLVALTEEITFSLNSMLSVQDVVANSGMVIIDEEGKTLRII